MTLRIRWTENSKSFHFYGRAEYWVLYDFGSGSKDRYDTYIVTADDPVRIGCELPLETSKELIREYEQYFKKEPYLGDRKTMQQVVKIIAARRRKRKASK